MQLASLAVVLLLSAPTFSQENEAEKLFRAMEKKVQSAKTLEIVVEGEVHSGGKKAVITAKAWVGKDNTCRVESQVDFEGKAIKDLIVSDGKTIYRKDGESGQARTWSARPGDCERLRSYLARLGVVTGAGSWGETIPVGPPPGGFDLDKEFSLKDFKLGDRQKIDTKDAQAIIYEITFQRAKATAKTSVWIDTKTQLPLRRTVQMTVAGMEAVYVENYSTFAVDVKIDAKTFEVPNQ